MFPLEITPRHLIAETPKYSPFLSMANSYSQGNIQQTFRFSLKKEKKCQIPIRHMSLNYDHREKYVSTYNSCILNKINRPHPPQDQNLEFLMRNVPDQSFLYENDHDFNIPESPFIVKKLKSSFETNTDLKSPLKSPFVFRLTKIENNFRNPFCEDDNNHNSSLDEKAKKELKQILQYDNESDNENENDHEVLEQEEEKEIDYTLMEKNIYDFLEKEKVIWMEKPEFKKNKLKIIRKEFKIKSDLRERRKMNLLKVNMSSSCDDLTKFINVTGYSPNKDEN